MENVYDEVVALAQRGVVSRVTLGSELYAEFDHGAAKDLGYPLRHEHTWAVLGVAVVPGQVTCFETVRRCS